MSNQPLEAKLANHFANEENELEDVEGKLRDAEDKDRDVVVKLRSGIDHVEQLREVSAELTEQAKNGSLGTLNREHVESLIENTKGTVKEIDNAKEEVQQVLMELNKAESELKDVLEKAQTDKDAIMNK